MSYRVLLFALFFLSISLPAEAKTQFNCRVASVPANSGVTVDLYGPLCQERPTGPIDCLHFAIVSVGPTSGYVTFAHKDLSGIVTSYFPLWGPSPGWFHAPQHAISTPGLNLLGFVNTTNVPSWMRVVGIGLATGEPGCIS